MLRCGAQAPWDVLMQVKRRMYVYVSYVKKQILKEIKKEHPLLQQMLLNSVVGF